MTSRLDLIGFEDLLKTLEDTAPRVADNLARATVHDIASRMAKEVKASAPYRTGQLKKAVYAKRHRPKKNGRFASSVRMRAINKREDSNAFYWKFIEFGTRFRAATPFVLPIKLRFMSAMPQIYQESFGRKLEQSIARAKKRAAK